MTKKYSVLIGLEKSLFRTLVVATPILIGILPQEWMNVTLGTALLFVSNYAKNKDIEEVQDTSS